MLVFNSRHCSIEPLTHQGSEDHFVWSVKFKAFQFIFIRLFSVDAVAPVPPVD